MAHTDVFLCYRRPGAQTAKLFKRYLHRSGFPGEVWYSDSEPSGNYRDDIPDLVESASCAVLFIDDGFTEGFLEDRGRFECITALEVTEIAQRKLDDPDFDLVTIYLDRPAGLTETEIETLERLFVDADLDDPEGAARLISQNNSVAFRTATGDEEDLVVRVTKAMLTNDFYRRHIAPGDFHFGHVPTTVDVVLWDNLLGIEPANVQFSLDDRRIPLHRTIERRHSNVEYEIQDNQMVSLASLTTYLSDDTEEKQVDIAYKLIRYRLFLKTLKLWDSLRLDQKIAECDWRTEVYPIPNAMGLALSVITADDRLLITRRSPERAVRPHEYDCSIVEGLKPAATDLSGHPYDIDDEDYLAKEILRAFNEEVCSASAVDAKIYGLVLDRSYGQWNFVGAVRTDHTSDEIRRLHAIREDTYESNEIEFVGLLDAGSPDLASVRRALARYLKEGIWGMGLAAIYAGLLLSGFTHDDITALTEGF